MAWAPTRNLQRSSRYDRIRLRCSVLQGCAGLVSVRLWTLTGVPALVRVYFFCTVDASDGGARPVQEIPCTRSVSHLVSGSVPSGGSVRGPPSSNKVSSNRPISARMTCKPLNLWSTIRRLTRAFFCACASTWPRPNTRDTSRQVTLWSCDRHQCQRGFPTLCGCKCRKINTRHISYTVPKRLNAYCGDTRDKMN